MRRSTVTATATGLKHRRSVSRLCTALLLSASVTGQTAATGVEPIAPARKAAITSPVRDLELFFAIPLARLPYELGAGPDTWAEGLPEPPRVSLRDMATGTELPQDYYGNHGKTRFMMAQNSSQNWSRVLIKPMARVAVAPYSPNSAQMPPTYNVVLDIERLQPGVSVSVTSPGGEVTDRYTFGQPAQRATLDSSLYEAVPVTVERNGAPYTTLYFGYRMGLVAAQTAAVVPAAEREYYELAGLPAPTVEHRVTEYIYRPIANAATPRVHVFYTTNEEERAVLDNDENWMRSGFEFKSGGYVPVCRFFYRPPDGGPSTHFYTAVADQCQQLKTVAGFTFEGTPFRASLPRPPGTGPLGANDPARCPAKTVPVWRFFNQPTDSSVAPNHRYMLNRVVPLLRLVGSTPSTSWAEEGIAFCVPE